ncbi:hypothetical protein [Ruminococcus sp.]|uniref:hypothetical protein n=1 Tax=Ruminococcus sp. TaxID=41978 RepID=UPI00388F1BF8
MAEITFKQKTKTIEKLVGAGITTEKDLQKLTLDVMLNIPDITMTDLAIITALQTHTKDNGLFSYLSGGKQNE